MKRKIASIIMIMTAIIGLFMVKTLANEEAFEVDIVCQYDEKQNVVNVKAKSNRELKQKTLAGWVLRRG